MGPGQRVPWHYHPRTHDTLYVLEGGIRICLHDPEEDADLAVGETFGPIAEGRRHPVTSVTDDLATFLVLHGIDKFVFVAASPA
jgi:quercetin dioxygenase-like cupin family protein